MKQRHRELSDIAYREVNASAFQVENRGDSRSSG